MFKLDGVQPVWDKTVIDESKTTANFTLCQPEEKEVVFRGSDAPYEKYINTYMSVIKDGDIYRMYYQTNGKVVWPPIEEHCIEREVLSGPMKGLKAHLPNININYAESKDGIHWEKPNLGICEYQGSYNNNIILRTKDLEKLAFFDSFMVFIDSNPACPLEKKYKAIVNSYMNLAWFSSSDGIHWSYEDLFDMPGMFDTLDVCWYDNEKKKYIMYIRDMHERGTPMTVEDILNSPPQEFEKGDRDIRRTESEDFVHWTKPIPLTYENGTEDYQLYTNAVRPYYRNPNILIGFPTRYTERQEWTENYDELCGVEIRKEKMKTSKRLGLAITDGIFMSSRDGYVWTRYDEALFTNERERLDNWVYGDGYWAYHMMETPSKDGNYKEISMFMPTKPYEGQAYVTRYTFRLDGFACYTAPAKGAKVVTKPLVFSGTQMKINFSTSAYGNMYITIADKEGNSATSCEIFGNTDNRKVNFSKQTLEKFQGKEVVVTFEMKDAKLYSFWFE